MATEKKRVMISLTESQLADFETAARDAGLSKSGWVILALMEWKRNRDNATTASDSTRGD